MRSWFAPLVRAAFALTLTWTNAEIATAQSPRPIIQSFLPEVGLVQRVNIFNREGRDPREAVDLARELALRPVVQIPGSTAFLVSPCYALAAHHGVFGFARAPDARPIVQVMVPNWEDNGSSFRTVAASPEVWGEGDRQAVIREDWALLKLEICAGKRIGWLELMHDENTADLTSRRVSIAGYPNDKPKTQLWRDQTGEVMLQGSGPFRDWLLNTAATRGGNSGSPLYIKEDGTPLVVGMQVREIGSDSRILDVYDVWRANIAIDVRSIVRRIGRILSTDKEAFWAERLELEDWNASRSRINRE